MKARRIVCAILAALMFTFLLPSLSQKAEAVDNYASVEGTELYSWSFEILELLNRDRARNGRPPLKMDAKLMEYAILRAYETSFNFDHTRPNGSASPYTICPEFSNYFMGENISMKGYNYSDPARVNDRLYDSPGHRSNMINSGFSCVGIGCVKIGPWVYTCELFGSPQTFTKQAYASQYHDVTRARTVNVGSYAKAPGGFSDVPINSYYEESVVWAVNKGITNGTSGTTFSPNENCTRAQIVTFLWRNAGSPKVNASNPFSDVKEGSYYYQAVLWAIQNGITVGTAKSTFSPDATCTRGEAVTFLWRAAGSPSANSAAKFTDVSSDAFYSRAVAWAVEKGVTYGTGDTTFSPNSTCTRAQIVTFLYRANK